MATDPNIKKIFDHYGLRTQLEKTAEEAVELRDAVCDLLYAMFSYKENDKYKVREKSIKHLAEEIADVRIMCDQLEYAFSLQDECEQQRKYKIVRQNTRMELDKHRNDA